MEKLCILITYHTAHSKYLEQIISLNNNLCAVFVDKLDFNFIKDPKNTKINPIKSYALMLIIDKDNLNTFLSNVENFIESNSNFKDKFNYYIVPIVKEG